MEKKDAKATKRARTPKAAAGAEKRESASAKPARKAAAESARPSAGLARVRVKLVRSTIGFDRKQAAVVRGLGLRGLHHTVELIDTPETRGMIHKVRHLVEVQ